MADMTCQELVRGYRLKGYKLKYYGKVKESHKKPRSKDQRKRKSKVKRERKTYRLYKTVINPHHKTTLLITAGFHGDEPNSPISLLEIIDEVAAFATEMCVRVIVYICINPSGFDLRKHYNASNEFFNNWFMLYMIEGGKWVGTLKDFDEPYAMTDLAKSPAKEVRLLQEDICKYYFPAPAAVLDIHQQHGNLKTGDIFAYIFDRLPVYYRIMNKLEKIAPIARNEAWKDYQDNREINYRIDEDGFVFVHDGTLTDLFHYLGSKYVVTSETKTTLSLDQVAKINLIWIKELIRLIARDAKRKKNKKKKKKK